MADYLKAIRDHQSRPETAANGKRKSHKLTTRRRRAPIKGARTRKKRGTPKRETPTVAKKRKSRKARRSRKHTKHATPKRRRRHAKAAAAPRRRRRHAKAAAAPRRRRRARAAMAAAPKRRRRGKRHAVKSHRRRGSHVKRHMSRAMNPFGGGEMVMGLFGVVVGGVVASAADRFASTHGLDASGKDTPDAGQMYNVGAPSGPIWGDWKRLAAAAVSVGLPLIGAAFTKGGVKSFLQTAALGAVAVVGVKAANDGIAMLGGKNATVARLYGPEIQGQLNHTAAVAATAPQASRDPVMLAGLPNQQMLATSAPCAPCAEKPQAQAAPPPPPPAVFNGGTKAPAPVASSFNPFSNPDDSN